MKKLRICSHHQAAFLPPSLNVPLSKKAKMSEEITVRVEVQLLKIGRILSTRWVASSYRSVLAVWTNYEALVQHFEEAKLDPTRDKKDKCT